MDDFEIVHATADDWQAIKELRIEAVTTDSVAFGSTLAEVQGSDEAFWRKRFETSIYICARKDGKFVGMAVLALEKGEKVKHVGMIYGVYVSPSVRGKGIGKLIMEELLRTAKEKGVLKVRLYVVDTQEAAIALYRSLGFYKMADYKAEMREGDIYVDEIGMEKFLA